MQTKQILLSLAPDPTTHQSLSVGLLDNETTPRIVFAIHELEPRQRIHFSPANFPECKHCF